MQQQQILYIPLQLLALDWAEAGKRSKYGIEDLKKT
jgi:hypothetical protein